MVLKINDYLKISRLLPSNPKTEFFMSANPISKLLSFSKYIATKFKPKGS